MAKKELHELGTILCFVASDFQGFLDTTAVPPSSNQKMAGGTETEGLAQASIVAVPQGISCAVKHTT
jgi:hypothetical protein